MVSSCLVKDQQLSNSSQNSCIAEVAVTYLCAHPDILDLCKRSPRQVQIQYTMRWCVAIDADFTMQCIYRFNLLLTFKQE